MIPIQTGCTSRGILKSVLDHLIQVTRPLTVTLHFVQVSGGAGGGSPIHSRASRVIGSASEANYSVTRSSIESS